MAIVGDDVDLGWSHFWGASALYLCVPYRVRIWAGSPVMYGGECVDFSRRLRNHDSRIMFPTGSSQQPFYDVIRCGATELPAVRACASAWFFLPCRRASLDRDCRKAAEEVWIEEHRLLLNSPSVYAYLQWLRSS